MPWHLEHLSRSLSFPLLYRHAATISACLVLATLPIDAQAHRLERSYLDVQADGQRVSAVFDLHPDDFGDDLRAPLDLDRSGRVTVQEMRQSEAALGELAATGLRFSLGGHGCRSIVHQVRVSEAADMARVRLLARCGGDGSLRVEAPILAHASPRHVLLLTVRQPEGPVTVPLTTTRATYRAGDEDSPWQQAWDFLAFGVHHILAGVDHLLFLFAIMLGVWTWRALLIAVTSFTLGHSITLAVAALDVYSLPTNVVEPLIAFSIAAVALESVVPRLTWGRPAVVALFGLVHGFGFAGVLGEMGLPTNGRAVALAAFNTGVELGQLAVIAAVGFPLMAARRRWPNPSLKLARLASLALVLVGLGWGAWRVASDSATHTPPEQPQVARSS